MSNYLEASNTSNNTLLEKLDYEEYEGRTYHVNFKINTSDTTVKGLYTSKKTQLDSNTYKQDAHKDSGIPIYMPEGKTFPPMTITEVDFKIEAMSNSQKRIISTPPVKPKISPSTSFFKILFPNTILVKSKVRIGFKVVTSTPPAPASPI